MGKTTSYSSPKLSDDSSKTTTYESTKTTKVSSYDSSKASSYESEQKVSPSETNLNKIKALIISYLEVCQKIEDTEFALVELKTKRDVLKDRISACPNADKFIEALGFKKDSDNKTKR